MSTIDESVNKQVLEGKAIVFMRKKDGMKRYFMRYELGGEIKETGGCMETSQLAYWLATELSILNPVNSNNLVHNEGFIESGLDKLDFTEFNKKFNEYRQKIQSFGITYFSFT